MVPVYVLRLPRPPTYVLPLCNILFSTLDLFAMTIHVASSPSKAQATVIIVTHVTK
jgi:hypothetical protein